MAFTKFKLLAERLLSGLGRSKTFFPFYDSQNDADYRVSLDTLITFISNELGVSSKAVFELTGVSNTGNNYVSTLDITSYKTEGLYIFKPSVDSDDVSTLNVNSIGVLDIKEFNGTSIVDKTDLKAVNTYLLLNKTSYWLVVGGVSGGSGGVSTFSALTDSPYDNVLLAEALNSKQDKPNGVLTGCTITLGSFPLGKNVRITEGTWRISPGEYGNVGSGDTDFLVALSASGLQRFVELVGTSSNTIIKVEGAENAIAVRPTLGVGQVSLGSILVKDALIDPPVPDLSGYIPLIGTPSLIGDITASVGAERTFGYNTLLIKARWVFSYLGGFAESWLQSKVNDYEASVKTIGFDGLAQVQISVGNGTISKTLVFASEETCKLQGDILRLDDIDRNSAIASQPKALITKEFADANYLGGSTNLGYTSSPTNGIVTSDTGTDATIPLADGTNAGLASPSMKSTWDNKQNTLFVPSDAEMQAGTDNVKYATALRITTWLTWIKTQAQTISGLWTFSGGITISNGKLLFTNTSTVSGDGIYRSASNVITTSIANNARHEVNNLGVRTKGTHTFEGTMFTNLTPTVKKIATIQTNGELTTDYTPTAFFQAVQRILTFLVSSTTETSIFNPEIGATVIPASQMYLGSQWLYTIPFKLSTTGTVRFLVRFGEAATALTSRTLIADTGNFSPAVTAQGGVLKVMFSVGAVGASGTANVVCNIEVQINGKNPVITVPLRTSSGVSTLVDNLLEIDCIFGTSSASDRIDIEMGNSLKLS